MYRKIVKTGMSNKKQEVGKMKNEKGLHAELIGCI